MAPWSYSSIFFSAIKLSLKLNSSNPEFPRQLEVIIDHVKQHLERTRGKYIPINFHPRSYGSNAFVGTIEDFQSKVDIYYDWHRNKCWKRFILAKELCHLIYDFPGNTHLASTPEEIGSLLRQLLAGLVANFEKDHAASSEQAAVLMAIEILLPHSERKNVNKIISDGGDTLEVAKKYLLPEQMASIYLDTHYASVMENVVREYHVQNQYDPRSH